MRRRYTILVLVAVGLFLMPALGSAIILFPRTTYTFLDVSTNYGAFVDVMVEGEQSAAAEEFWVSMGGDPGCYNEYTYTYQVLNTATISSDGFSAIDDINDLTFLGRAINMFGTNPGTGDVDVILTASPTHVDLYGMLRFDFDGGLHPDADSDTSVEFWVTSYYKYGEISSVPFINTLPEYMRVATLEDGETTAFGDLTSDLVSQTGSPISTAVPEPATLLLVGSGLLTAACFRRYREKNSVVVFTTVDKSKHEREEERSGKDCDEAIRKIHPVPVRYRGYRIFAWGGGRL